MSSPLFITNTITINAPASAVWNALVNPEETKKYMYGCEALSDWKPGSPLIWKGVFDGVELIAVKGEIVEIIPDKKLVYTVIDPSGPYEDIPANYLVITYDLSSNNGSTIFTVSQGDYSKAPDGEKRFKEAFDGGGWSGLLTEIKTLVEGAS